MHSQVSETTLHHTLQQQAYMLFYELDPELDCEPEVVQSAETAIKNVCVHIYIVRYDYYTLFVVQVKRLSLSLKHTHNRCMKKREEALLCHIRQKDSVKALATAEELKQIIKPCVKDTICVNSHMAGMQMCRLR